ncbi:hypothetical protein Pdw03_5287 [Penicillium digitatum]|uniref:Uncharacterized protein n=1 Tax=Penicillium digitatum TaxID=36651 RepID=A0A7T6XUS3_PENDI|nr:hypothetical protein Pdw03_5287 [Penicillium digitatum]
MGAIALSRSARRVGVESDAQDTCRFRNQIRINGRDSLSSPIEREDILHIQPFKPEITHPIQQQRAYHPAEHQQEHSHQAACPGQCL